MARQRLFRRPQRVFTQDRPCTAWCVAEELFGLSSAHTETLAAYGNEPRPERPCLQVRPAPPNALMITDRAPAGALVRRGRASPQQAFPLG